MSNQLHLMEQRDLCAVENALASRLAEVRRFKSALVVMKLKEDPSERIVTDHALLRYMQRHLGVDVDAIRNDLRRIAAESTPAKDGEHHWHDSGVMLILGEDGRVVTCLSPEQAEKWSGRKLKDGSRVPLVAMKAPA